MLGLSNADLARLAKIGVNTLTRAERGQAREATMQKLRSALESAGTVFIPENGGGVGVRLARRSDDAGAESDE